MRIEVALNGNLRSVMAKENERLKRLVKAAMVRTSGELKQHLRSQIVSAGLGARLARTWRDEVYPRGAKTSMSPAAMVWSRAAKVVRAFDEGVVIRGKGGLWLAIPTEYAGKQGIGRKRISPANFPEHRYGPLRFVFRRNGPSLLVVDSVRVKGENKATRRYKNDGKTKSGQYRAGMTTVIMFFLVPQVKMPKRLDVQGARAWAARQLSRNVADFLVRA